MTKFELSVYFETISFFLVAIDLYGKKRLDKTHRRIVVFSRFMTKRIDRFVHFDWHEKRRSVAAKFIVFFAVMGGLVRGIYYVTRNLPEGVGFELSHIPEVLYNTFLFSLIIFLVVMVLIMVGIGVILIVTWISRKILFVISKILSIVNFEGLLLVTGTLLFLISKWLDLASQ